MSEIHKIFKEIQNEPGTNAKMDILRKYVNNDTLRNVLYLANSPRIKFWIKDIPEYTPSGANKELCQVLPALSVLSERIVTGHDARAHLREMLEDLSPEGSYILERIIEKDCKIGMGTTNMNKIFKGLIEETPYMGAKAFSPKLVQDLFKGGQKAISELKMDGRYANGIICEGSATLESRQGEVTHLEGAQFVEDLKKFKDQVLNGELTMNGISRYKSNGIIASLVSIGGKIHEGQDVAKEIAKFQKETGMSYQEALDKIQYTVWDSITLEEYNNAKSDRARDIRLHNLVRQINSSGSHLVKLITGRVISTYQEALDHFQEVIQNGEEGTIVKALKGTWKDGKPNYQIKMKLEMTFDLRIIGFEYGTRGTKNENVISTLMCESSDGLLKTNPSGMKEDMMKYITEHQPELLGTVVQCKSSGISQNKDGAYSMLHPRVDKLRDDKMSCDSLQSLLEIEAMAKGLK